MDWTELQRASRETAEDRPDREAMQRMRLPMERRIHEEERRLATASQKRALLSRGRRRLPWAAGFIGVAAAFALVVGLAINPMSAPRAEAAALLQRASRFETSTATDRPSVVSINAQFVDGIVAGAASAPNAAVERTTRTVLRVPDDGQEWVRKSWTVSRAYAYGDKRVAGRELAEPAATRAQPMFELSKTGAFVNNPPRSSQAEFGLYPGNYRNLPRQPAALLKTLQVLAQPDGDASSDSVLQAAARVLTSGVADVQLRAAVFSALQGLQDVRIVSRHATDLDGRDGLAIGTTSGDGSDIRTWLIFDQATGQYLGERDWSRAAYGVIPAGTLLYADAVEFALPTDCCGAWQPARSTPAKQYP